MAFTITSLQQAIEQSPFLLPELERLVQYYPLPGAHCRITASSDFFANLVGGTTLGSHTALTVINQIKDLFTEQQKTFGWIVGPCSAPSLLGLLLQSRGLTKIVDLIGMAHTNISQPIPTNPAVEIRVATHTDSDSASRLLAPALGISHEGAVVTTQALLHGQDRQKARVYLASLAGIDEPVGYGSMIYFPDQPIAVLYCAATHRQYRQQGVYTALLARRLADAARDGMEAVVIQAVATTSAPVCRKHGFAELSRLDWYAWFPNGE